jgi:two-component system NarL family sensor kinase
VKSIVLVLASIILVLGSMAQTADEIETQARALRNDGSYHKAIDLLSNYLPNAELTLLQKAHLTNLRGHIRGNIHDFENQLLDFLAAKDLREQAGDKAAVGGSYLNLGNSYKFQKQHEKSLEYYTLARSIARENNDSVRWVKAINNMAGAMRQVKPKTERYDLLAEGLDIARKLDKRALLISNLMAHANAYSDFGHPENSIEYLREALALKTSKSSTNALILNNLGNAYKHINELDSALLYYRLGYGLAITTSNLDRQITATRNFADLYAEKGMFDSAHHYLEVNRLLQIEINYRQIDDEVLKYQEQFQAAERELEIEQKTAQRNLMIAILGGLGVLAVVVVFFLIRNHRQKMVLATNELDLKDSQISNLFTDLTLKVAKSEAEGELKERQRVGRDLHDRIGPLLSSIKIKFSSLKRDSDENNEWSDSINLLDDSIGEIRRISHNLSSGSLSRLGFVNHIVQLGKHLGESGKINVNFTHHNLEQGLGQGIESHLSDIISELAQNTLKYADATNLSIDINRDEEELSVIIEDDGKGFDTNSHMQGIGLKNLRMRVAEMEGELVIDSKIGRGTAVVIDIPLNQPKLDS